MIKLHRNTWFVLALIFAICVTVMTLKHFVTSPWRTVGELGGDGAKNNFTYLYHAMYGKGYWFEGMNYPYGEHIVYTDGQPIISVPLTWFRNVTPGKALTVMWLLIDLSYVLAMLFIYRILRYFKVGPPFAIIFSGLITVFSPQILRIQGHYALAYTCIIPMIFYWLIRYHEDGRWRYVIWFFVTGCLTSFLHPYYAAMMLIWAGGYGAGYFIFTKATLWQKIRRVAPLLGAIFGVFALLAAVMKLTDPVKDRPVTPMNTFFETCTHLRQLITSSHSLIWKFLRSKHVVYNISSGGEGYAYMGFVILITVFIFLLLAVVKSARLKRLSIVIEDTGFSPVWLFIALIALILGMGIPFIWHRDWLNYLSVFKQFRSLGRFTWICYHIIAIYTVVALYWACQRLVQKRMAFAGYAILLLAMGIWSYEAKAYVGYCRYRADYAMYNYEMIFSKIDQPWEAWLKDNHYDKEDFQAILLLPFYHIGTEKIWIGQSEWIITLGTKAALQLHLPLVDVMMSRSSWSQALKQVKIAAGPFASKPMLGDISSPKPFLLLHFEEDSLNPDQKYLLTASDFIGKHSQCNVYAFYPGRLAANSKKIADSIGRIAESMSAGDSCITGQCAYYVDHFDSHRSPRVLFSTGAVSYDNADSATIARIPVHPEPGHTEYEFSCWFLVSDRDYKSPFVQLQCIDSAGALVDTVYANTNKSVDSRGMWFRDNKFLKLKESVRHINCILYNCPKPAYLAMDELMFRPSDATIISKGKDGTIMVNNHIFREALSR